MRLAGKTAIVTGAASGMGAAEAALFAAEGARVYACDIRDEPGQEVVEKIRHQVQSAKVAKGEVPRELSETELNEIKSFGSE